MPTRVRVTEGKEGRQLRYSLVFRLEVDIFTLYSFRDIQ